MIESDDLSFRKIWPQASRRLLVLLVFDCAVAGLYSITHSKWLTLDGLPLAPLGSALTIFLAFRANAAYGRWWEARQLWGSLVNTSRSLARQFLTLIDDDGEVGLQLKRQLVRYQISFAHALRCHLRHQNPFPELSAALNPDQIIGIELGAGQWSFTRLTADGAFFEDMSKQYATHAAPGTGEFWSTDRGVQKIEATTSGYVRNLPDGTRQVFDKPLAGYQLTQAKLADMAVELGKAQLLALHLGRLKDDGRIRQEQVSFGKLNNVREAIKIARQCRTLLGANGITLEYPVIRHANNLESVLTYEGTSEVHQLIIGEALTGVSAFR